jgi:hypothetical protein
VVDGDRPLSITTLKRPQTIVCFTLELAVCKLQLASLLDDIQEDSASDSGTDIGNIEERSVMASVLKFASVKNA